MNKERDSKDLWAYIAELQRKVDRLEVEVLLCQMQTMSKVGKKNTKL